MASEVLSDDGIVLIQTRYENDKLKYKPKFTNYKQNAVFFTSYKIDEFWSIVENVGFKPLFIRLKPELNYAYYLMVKG